MFPLRLLTIICVAFICAVGRLAGGEYCSLVVKVETPLGGSASGIPGLSAFPETRVVVEESNGWRTEGATVGGIARYCGLGVQAVTAIVGSSPCNQVTVRNIPLMWNVMRTITVVYDPAPCQYEPMPRFGCAILLRFVDAEHRPVRAAEFAIDGATRALNFGDEYGRLMVAVRFGTDLLGQVAAKGYHPARVSATCARSDAHTREQIVVLEQARP